MHFVSPNLYVCTHQQLLEPTSLLLQVGTRPLSKPQPLFPQVAVKGKNESSLTETAHRVPYHVSKAPLRSAKAAQHAAATSQATTTLSYSTPRGRYSAWGPPQPFTPLRPSHKRTSPPRPPLQLGPARTPSSALACKDPSSAAARSFSGNRLAEKVRHAPPVSKRKGGTARHASPTIDITTSAEAALIPAWTPATPRTPSTPCDKPSKDPPAPLSMPASTANHGPQVLNPPAHEGQVTAGQGQHEAPRVDTPYPFATAATPNTVCSPTPPMLEPALGPSSTPASLQGMTHLSNKDSSLSKCQTPLQVPPCTPAPFLAAPGTHHEPEGERDEGNTTSSALIGPATTHSSTAAADASTPTSACLAGSAEVLVMLEGNGWMERGRFPHTTTLGEVVLRWAQHTSTAVNIIKLRHASDDEYLSDDYWWSPLGQIRLVTNRLLLLEVIVDNFNLVCPGALHLLFLYLFTVFGSEPSERKLPCLYVQPPCCQVCNAATNLCTDRLDSAAAQGCTCYAVCMLHALGTPPEHQTLGFSEVVLQVSVLGCTKLEVQVEMQSHAFVPLCTGEKAH